jgi:DNA-binding NtrC family response regulator
MVRVGVPPSTLELEGSNTAGSGRGDEALPALLIAWADAEPERVGDVAMFEHGAGAMILGRGEQAAGRVEFYRQRPGTLERRPPLISPGISREQLRIRREGDGLRVERIGRCAMELRGQRVDRAVLAPGDALVLKGQLVLFCTRRPRRLAALQSAALTDPPGFGAPDAHGVVGESPAAWRLRDQLAWMAQADEHTLILGASGAGKELCARAIHAQSTRARGPFIARNASTIPHGLIDAELFGNVKGYPNPGMPERPGLIGAADGGTLFLDEIGELPHGLQASLLRVLDDGGEYMNLGGAAAKRSRFRLLGATNRELTSLKHDVAARLVLRLEVPGVDERRDDIPFLIRHLLRRAAARSPEATRRFLAPGGELQVKPSLVAHLLQAPYPTHVRELAQLLWRAMSASTGRAIEWVGEPPATGSDAPASPEPAPPAAVPVEDPAGPEPSEAELRAALAAHGSNIVRTAQALRLSSRYVLYRLMRKHGIEG